MGRRRLFAWLVPVLLLAPAAALSAPDALPTTPAALPVTAGVSWERNEGQFGAEVLFRARGAAYEAAVTATGLALVADGTRVEVRFEGAAPLPAQGLDPLAETSSYYLGDDPGAWVLGARHYGRVVHPSAWPGVDVVFRDGGEGFVEFDFVVAPGADARVARFSLSGATGTRIDPDGHLVARAGAGEIRFPPPFVFQRTDAGLREVEAAYAMGDGFVSVSLGAYDPALPVVVDPRVVWTRTPGGSGAERVWDVARTAAGDSVIVGSTSSTDFPASNEKPGGKDGFLLVSAPDGARRLSVYFGGSASDEIVGVAVDADGNAFLAGTTWGGDFPILGGAQATHGGYADGFAARVRLSDGALAWSTFAGGSGYDYGVDVALGTGYAVVAVEAGSSGLWTHATAYQRSYAGQGDAYLVAYAADGGARRFATYLGGSSDDGPAGVAVGPDGTLRLAVSTYGSFPDAGSSRGSYDVVVAKLSGSAERLNWSQRLGGTDYDVARGLAVGPDGAAYVVGETYSTNFVVSGDAVQTTKKAGMDGFVARLQSNMNVAWSTYLGSAGSDGIHAVDVDADGRVYVVGTFEGADAALLHPFRSDFVGPSEGYVAVHDASTGARLLASYYGGSWSDELYGVDAADRANVSVGGWTLSWDLGDGSDDALSQANAVVALLDLRATPFAPENLTGDVGAFDARLNWSAPSDGGDRPVLGYRVYRDGVLVAETSETGFVDVGLWHDTTYAYGVSAYSETGEGDVADLVLTTLRAVPTAVRNLSWARGAAHDEMELAWEAPADAREAPVETYRVYRDGALVGDVGLSLGFTDSGLGYNLTPAYRVVAVNAYGEGDPAHAIARTYGVASEPLAISAHANASLGFVVSWSAPADDGGFAVEGYEVWRSNGTAGPVFVANATTNSTLDPSPPPEAVVAYLVSARNAMGVGAPGAGTAATPSPPAQLAQPDVRPGSAPRALNVTFPTEVDARTLPWTGFALERFDEAEWGEFSYGRVRFDDETYETSVSMYLKGDRVAKRLLLNTSHLAGGAEFAVFFTATAKNCWSPGWMELSVNGGRVGEFNPCAVWSTTSVQTWGFLVPRSLFDVGINTVELRKLSDDSDLAIMLDTSTWYGYTELDGPWGPKGELAVYGRYDVRTGDRVSRATADAFVEDAGLAERATYVYRAAATSAVGPGIFSQPVFAVSPEYPAAPLSLSGVRGPGAGEISLSWAPPSDDGGWPVTSYRVYRGPPDGALAYVASSSTASFRDGGLAASTEYAYAVSAVTALGEGALAAPVVVRSPGTPLAVTSTSGWKGPGMGAVTVNWLAPDDGGFPIQSYRIYRGTEPGLESFVAETTGTSWTDGGLPDNATYFYRVGAVNSAGESDAGSSVGLTTFARVTPLAPKGFAAKAELLAPHEVRLTWQKPADNGGPPVHTYYVYRGTSEGNEVVVAILGAGATSYVDKPIGLTTRFHYKLSAINLVGEGAHARTTYNVLPWP